MAPIFVGSNADDSKIKLDRVSIAVSTADPGSASIGDAYYSSGDNNLKFYNGSSWSAAKGSGTIDATVSGSLSDGQPVILQSDGTVAGVALTNAVSASFGTGVVYNAGNQYYKSVGFSSHMNKVVISYSDPLNGNYGTAVVADIDGTTISYGPESVYESAYTSRQKLIIDSTGKKIYNTYVDEGNSQYGTIVIGKIRGNAVTWSSSPVVFSNSSTGDISVVVHEPSGSVVISYRNAGSGNAGTIRVGRNGEDSNYSQPSFDTLEFGSAQTFELGTVYSHTLIYDPSTDKIVIFYSDTDNSGKGTARVGTVDPVNRSITFGSEVVFEELDTNTLAASYDSAAQKIVIAYNRTVSGTGVNKGWARVGTVSGSGASATITFGTAVQFSNTQPIDIGIYYNIDSNKHVLAYNDNGNSNYGTLIEGTVSGSDITFGSKSVYNTAYTDANAAVYIGKDKGFIAYRDSSSNGTGIVYTGDHFDTNLTSENFVGFSAGAYTNGQTASIQIVSTIDDAQSGLSIGKKHYVQNDGTLSTIEGDPSVFAGTAISATKISVKH